MLRLPRRLSRSRQRVPRISRHWRRWWPPLPRLLCHCQLCRQRYVSMRPLWKRHIARHLTFHHRHFLMPMRLHRSPADQPGDNRSQGHHWLPISSSLRQQPQGVVSPPPQVCRFLRPRRLWLRMWCRMGMTSRALLPGSTVILQQPGWCLRPIAIGSLRQMSCRSASPCSSHPHKAWGGR